MSQQLTNKLEFFLQLCVCCFLQSFFQLYKCFLHRVSCSSVFFSSRWMFQFSNTAFYSGIIDWNAKTGGSAAAS
jgi:hypothetical protein